MRGSRGLRALGVASVLVALLVLAGTAAGRVGGGGAERFVQASDGSIESSQLTPLGLSKEPVTVTVQLGGQTVAEVEGDRGSKLSKAERRQVRDQLKATQDGLRGQIQSLGGKVLADYQYAFNGVKVRIARDKVGDLEALPGVVNVRSIMKVKPDNTNGVPLVGAPAVWAGVPGYRGEGVKVAIIDTGIDYTHADFGGPGTAAAYAAADATDTAPADPSLFGPAAPKVKGGIDLAGDDYDAGSDDPALLVPHPDPNPLDCNGHGTHVAGTAVGFGVKADGSTYTGPYNASTVSSQSWTVGPGVAPKADLYSVRVFGCEGSTDLTVDAIEWAVENDMDVINMSLGSPFGTGDDASAVAASNAAKAGVIVVASAGNSGANQYITGSPASGDGVISVAANDPTQQFLGAAVTTPAGVVTAINANGEPFSTMSLTVKRLVDNPATTGENEALGCSVGAYGGPLPPNTLAVVTRGTCARVAKAIFGQQAGAAAVLMVNTSNVLPPFEGKITSNPDDGTPYTVTIPFFGVKSSDGAKFVTGNVDTISPAMIPNANFTGFADFSSGGPRTGDSWLKPDVTAPGVSTMSAAVGTGNGMAILSGTSMAAPHVTGVAALVRQAHASWRKVEDLKAAIVNTGNPAGVAGYRTSRGGSGFVQAPAAVATSAVAVGDKGTATLNFGFGQLRGDYSRTKTIKVRNFGSSAITFSIAQTNAAGSPHTVSAPSSVTVGPRSSGEVPVTLNVPVATAGDASAFREVAGLITLTPAAGQNADVTLRVPYYLVPRALSDVDARADDSRLRSSSPSTNVSLRNGGAIAGNADFYAWGLADRQERGGVSNDLRAVGVQVFPNPSSSDPTRRLLVFALNTWDRWSNAATNEFDVNVDVDNDGVVDYVVVGIDNGALTTGSFNGLVGSSVFSTRSPGASTAFLADAPTDSTTMLLPVRTSQLCRPGEPCLSQATNPRITYSAVGFDLIDGGVDEVDGTARFNVWSPSIDQGMFETLAPGATADVPVAIDPAEWAVTPALGLMVVTADDAAGRDEADLVPLSLR